MNELMNLPVDVLETLDKEEMLLVRGGITLETSVNNGTGVCLGINNNTGSCTGTNNNTGSCTGSNNGNGRCLGTNNSQGTCSGNSGGGSSFVNTNCTAPDNPNP